MTNYSGNSLSEIANNLSRTAQRGKNVRKRRTRVDRSQIMYSKPKVGNKSARKFRVGAVGIINRHMLHEVVLARQIGGKIIKRGFKHLVKYNNIILLAPHRVSELSPLRRILLKYPDTKIILWWIGSDVLSLKKPKFMKTVGLLRKTRGFINLAVSDGLKTELSEYGIRSAVLPLIPDVNYDTDMPLPNKYTVAVYMPSHKTDFYNLKLIRSIARETSNVKYILYGNKTPLKVPEKNIEAVGWTNGVENIIRMSNCVLRLTDHEGFPKGLMEFSMCNRFTICNHEYPRMWTSGDIHEIADKIKEHPKLKEEDVAYFRNKFSVDNFRKELRGYLNG